MNRQYKEYGPMPIAESTAELAHLCSTYDVVGIAPWTEIDFPDARIDIEETTIVSGPIVAETGKGYFFPPRMTSNPSKARTLNS